MDNRIIPECYADTALVEALGYVKPNHQLNNSEVLKTLAKPAYNNQIGIGLIDKDKTQPPRLNEYQLYRKQGTIEIKRFPDSKRFVIIHPNIEKWTWDEGIKADVHTEKYKLPKEYSAYKKLCKSILPKEDESKLKNFFNALKSKNTEIKTLKKIVDDLVAEFG